MYEKTLETENLIIKDSKGDKRIEMKVDEDDDPRISIHPKDGGLPLMEIGMHDDKPSLCFRAKDTLYQNVFLISQVEDHFSMEFGTGSSLRIRLGFNENNDVFLAFFDYDTQDARIALVYKPESSGAAGLIVFDKDENKYIFPS